MRYPACRLSQTLAVVALLLTGAMSADAQLDTAAEKPPLRIATKIAEPFVIQEDDGSLHGISIELWKRVAEELGVDYDFALMPLDELLAAVESGEADVGIAAISVTPEREARMDLSHGYMLSGLGIATLPGARGLGILGSMRFLFTLPFLTAAGGLCILLLIVGVVMWAVERRRNPEEFGGRTLHGIGSGFWFSAVTMTTVGYGDKAPRSPAGRIVAFIWMFASIIVISAFTGTIASSLTAAQIATDIRSREDLADARVGVVEGAVSGDAVRQHSVFPKTYASVDAGLQAVIDGEIDAFVHDRPLLTWTINQSFGGELVMPEAEFAVSSYAMALPTDSTLVEPVNRAVLSVTRDPSWNTVLSRYLGSP